VTSFEAVRAREYPALDGIFFNAASWGLLPRRTVDAVGELTARRNRSEGFEEEELVAILARARAAAARLVSATPAEIALSPNTSFGVNLAAACIAQGPPASWW
jgi:selenocysteine lyase/cysteine desulfurase